MKFFSGIFLAIFITAQAFAGEMILLSALEKESRGYQIGIGMVTAVGDKIGIDFIYKNTPNKRLFKLLEQNDGKSHGSLVNLDGLEDKIPTLVKVEEPIFISPIVAVASKNFEINGWEGLSHHKICHRLGMKIVEQNLAAHNLKSHPLIKSESALKFVVNGRADIFLTPPTLVARLLEKPEFSSLKILSPPVAVHNFHTYFFKEHAHIAEQFSRALIEMKKDGTYHKLLKP